MKYNSKNDTSSHTMDNLASSYSLINIVDSKNVLEANKENILDVFAEKIFIRF